MSDYTGVVLVPVPNRRSWHLLQNGTRVILTEEQAKALIKEELLDGQTRYIRL